MDYDSLAELAAVNIRLKADKISCRVEQRGSRLGLRFAEVDPQGRKRQTRVPLGLAATPIGLAAAEQAARRHARGDAVTRDAFAPQVAPRRSPESACLALQEIFAGLYGTAWDRTWGSREQIAWELHWLPLERALAGLPEVSEAALLGLVHTYPAGSCRRRDQGYRLARIAAALGFDPKPLREAAKGYNKQSLKPRSIPTDDDIVRTWESIKLPHWKWVFGMMAAYGLRSPEVVGLEPQEDNGVVVDEDNKTGSRLVYPCPSEWVEVFDLKTVREPKTTKRKISPVMSLYLREHGVTIKPYSLRHAYALRLLAKGVSISLAAKLMGHTTAIHEQTYQRWINAAHIKEGLRRFDL